MTFKKYMHLERFGTSGVRDIEVGTTYIFPKIDGTNASIWCEDGEVQCGSRNRHLSYDNDNAGFLKHIEDNADLIMLTLNNEHYTFYGEWLVPHALKTYEDDAWRQFYIFDVYDRLAQRYIPYDEYQPMLEMACVPYIKPMAVLRDATFEQLTKLCEENTYLITEGVGEGIVIKNYNYENQWGHTLFAKMLSEKFTGDKIKAGNSVQKDMIEAQIAEKYVTLGLINKVIAKMELVDGWGPSSIPRLLNTVYHDIIDEEMWDILKTFKEPSLNFKMLKGMVIRQIKVTKPELF